MFALPVRREGSVSNGTEIIDQFVGRWRVKEVVLLLIVIERFFVAVSLPSDTWIVKLYVLAVVGVPDITPVEELRERLGGKLPDVIDQVYVPVPPVA